jgi:hypothetical protein
VNRGTKLFGCLVAAAALSIPASAVAFADDGVSPHCPRDGYCLFSLSGFSGTQVVVPPGTGCRAVATAGIEVARSAARGYGDSSGLRLFADPGCAGPATDVRDEVASVEALAYQLIPLPGRTP